MDYSLIYDIIPEMPIALASVACLQWIVLRAIGTHLPQPWAPLLPGLCILGAAFLLTWAAEAAEMDLPQSLSIGILALIAVLPEYAVDMYFAWKAPHTPSYAAYATANMTGANRLLIGVGWPAVLFACWFKRGQGEIRLSDRNALELVTLIAATLYSFLLPLKASISPADAAVLLGLFAAYVWFSAQASVEEPEIEGTALAIAKLPKGRRRLTLMVLFLFSAGAIILSAEPFAEGILDLGRHWGIEEFLLVQWLAPLASEAPEFIVAILFALKGKAAVGLRALVSSKVNQWTLLVGMLPLVYSLSAGSFQALPLDARQAEEIFLTSAQSLFGMVLLMNLAFSVWEALALLILFASQLLFQQTEARYAFAWAYIAFSVVLLVAQRGRIRRLGELVLHIVKPRRPI